MHLAFDAQDHPFWCRCRSRCGGGSGRADILQAFAILVLGDDLRPAEIVKLDDRHAVAEFTGWQTRGTENTLNTRFIADAGEVGAQFARLTDRQRHQAYSVIGGGLNRTGSTAECLNKAGSEVRAGAVGGTDGPCLCRNDATHLIQWQIVFETFVAGIIVDEGPHPTAGPQPRFELGGPLWWPKRHNDWRRNRHNIFDEVVSGGAGLQDERLLLGVAPGLAQRH